MKPALIRGFLDQLCRVVHRSRPLPGTAAARVGGEVVPAVAECALRAGAARKRSRGSEQRKEIRASAGAIQAEDCAHQPSCRRLSAQDPATRHISVSSRRIFSAKQREEVGVPYQHRPEQRVRAGCRLQPRSKRRHQSRRSSVPHKLLSVKRTRRFVSWKLNATGAFARTLPCATGPVL